MSPPDGKLEIGAGKPPREAAVLLHHSPLAGASVRDKLRRWKPVRNDRSRLSLIARNGDNRHDGRNDKGVLALCHDTCLLFADRRLCACV